MKVTDALTRRKPTCAFLSKAIEVEITERILNVARHAHSGGSAQLWQAAVVVGGKKHQLDRLIESVFRSGIKEKMDYQYYLF